MKFGLGTLTDTAGGFGHTALFTVTE